MSAQLESGYDAAGVDINSELDVAMQAMNDSSLLIETFNVETSDYASDSSVF